MRQGALRPYEQALLSGRELTAVTGEGQRLRWDVGRWLAPINDADRTVLARCVGPTLDVGCGPGRFVHACATAGQIALGVDIAATAVELTARRGAAVLLRDVFERVPGEGRWQTVLLMDGNIGISGDPASLLARLGQLLAPRGQLLVEADPDETADQRLTVRLSDDTGLAYGPAFEWALIGRIALARHAAVAGLRYSGSWEADGRVFVRLTLSEPPAP
jgi:SAM-dependent methyltransferase